jgi:DUF1365 family protein
LAQRDTFSDRSVTEPALLLHAGRVSHVRHAPFLHRFAYRIWMLSVNLDRIDAAGSALFGHNRFAVISLHDRDHGPRDGSDLAGWVRAALARAGMPEFGASIRFMAIPRVFGWAFNPIAFYFCRDAAGRLGAVLHQVKNTFGDQHGYLLPVEMGPAAPALIRQQTGKRLHVSPFFDLQGGYRFAFRAPSFQPGGRFDLSLRYGQEHAPRLTATMTLATVRATNPAILRELIQQPFMPVKVYAAIHWQALRLWLRGAVFHPTPAAPADPVSLGSHP